MRCYVNAVTSAPLPDVPALARSSPAHRVSTTSIDPSGGPPAAAPTRPACRESPDARPRDRRPDHCAHREAVMKTPARIREPRVLRAQLAALAPRLGWVGDYSRRGGADALRWLIAGGPGPLTGQREELPVSAQAIIAELTAAEDLLRARPDPRQDYARGVGHALLWAQYATAAPPAGGAATVRDPQPVTPPRFPPGTERTTREGTWQQ